MWRKHNEYGRRSRCACSIDTCFPSLRSLVDQPQGSAAAHRYSALEPMSFLDPHRLGLSTCRCQSPIMVIGDCRFPHQAVDKPMVQRSSGDYLVSVGVHKRSYATGKRVFHAGRSTRIIIRPESSGLSQVQRRTPQPYMPLACARATTRITRSSVDGYAKPPLVDIPDNGIVGTLH